jgi:hypothetical protein
MTSLVSTESAKKSKKEIAAVHSDEKDLSKKLIFYCAKLPGIYLLMIIGIITDFILHLPFIVICTLENLFRRRSG